MAPPKRRKLSYEDTEPSNTNESGLSGIPLGEIEDRGCNDEVSVLSVDVSSTSSECALNCTSTEISAPTLGTTPDKDSAKRQIKNKIEDESMKPTRISERLIIKRNRLGDIEDEATGSSQTQTPRKGKGATAGSSAKQQQKKPETKKKISRKPGAHWTFKDKKLFFIYLGKFGKNFEAITARMAYNAKLHRLPQKDKMQVRYFYYRLWAKISKFINMNENNDVLAVTQELYGLINYGVLRNYVKESDTQFGRCLNELIYKGETSYTAKIGKTKRSVKMKTPVCTYLKKINRIEDKRLAANANAAKMPTEVMLELTPKDNKSWAKVQELSQNPRVRIKLSTNRTLESVFRYLGMKWKSNRIKLKESLGVKEEEPDDEEIICTLHPSCKITPLTFIPQEPQEIDITFTNYRENILPFVVKRKRNKVNKDQDKNVEFQASTSATLPISPPLQNENDTKSKSSVDESSDSIGKKDGVKSPLDKSESVVETKECKPIGSKQPENKNVSNRSSKKTSSVVSDLPEDENAVFLDLSKHTQPSTPDKNKAPPLPSTSATLQSPPPSSSQSSSVLAVTVPQTLPTLSVPPSPLSSMASAILSPSLRKRKPTKSTRKRTLSLDSNPTVRQDSCDISSVSSAVNEDDSSNKSGAASAATNIIKAEAEKELERLSSLAYSGFSITNSNNITLLHLSLILGRASLIRMEYEWREKIKSNAHVLPAFCRATSQMANVLRRLCNLAQLEFTSLPQEGKDSSKGAKSSASKSKKREGVKDVATMTDPIKHTAILQHPNAPILTGQPRTFIAANGTQAIQLNGHDSVFRVPFVPTFRPPAPTKEEQERLKLQEEQAKAIMQQGPKTTRLLKRRSVPSRNRKQPPIIVQRTLLPKVSSPMITYIQGPNMPQAVVVNVKPEDGTLGQPQPIASPETPILEPVAPNGSNILSLAVQAAEIDEFTVSSVSQNGLPSTNSTNDFSVSVSAPVQSTSPLSVSVTSFAPHLISSSSPVKVEPVSSVSSQADISLSDFDISLTGSNISNMGPGAGDKFLDSVLENSQQGFSGLINSTKKDFTSDGSSRLRSISVDTDLPNFDASMLYTPPHSSSSSSASYHPRPPSLGFPSPMNMSIGEQTWLSNESGDISLSSILGESSSFHADKPQLKTPTKSSGLSQSVFFDSSSSDAVDIKRPFVSDVSLSCLLDDSNLGAPKNLESQADSIAASHKENPAVNLFSSTVNLEVPPSNLFSEASQDSSFAKLDVDVTFQGMVSESSMDFVTKFETLAAHISSDPQDHDTSSKLNTPIKKECDYDEQEQGRRVDGFVGLNLKLER